MENIKSDFQTVIHLYVHKGQLRGNLNTAEPTTFLHLPIMPRRRYNTYGMLPVFLSANINM